MKNSILENIEKFVAEHKEETIELVKTLTSIPAPSHNEKQKAEFVLQWLKKQGAETAFIDEVYNVQFAYGCESGKDLVVYMAHLDVVFPDTTPFEVKEVDGKLYAPGVKDDNADLANMLMCIKYLLTYQPEVSVGLLFVANSCEEGLGNLKGSKKIYEVYGDRIREMLSFDGNYDRIVNKAVGSQRYCVHVKTEGGHSYGAFGNKNAIHQLSRMICSLYQIQVPTKAKTTYNVGGIEGGTSVNTIAESASMLYEFRSEDKECIQMMERQFEDVLAAYRKEGLDIAVEVLGIRPCGSGVDEKAQSDLVNKHKEIIQSFTDREVIVNAGSTDANTFLAHGIPSIVIGTAIGGGTHTRGEWIEKDSLVTGQKIGLASVLSYMN